LKGKPLMGQELQRTRANDGKQQGPSTFHT